MEGVLSTGRGRGKGGGGAWEGAGHVRTESRRRTGTDGAKREGGGKLSTGEESSQKPGTSFHDADPRQEGPVGVPPSSRDYK